MVYQIIQFERAFDADISQNIERYKAYLDWSNLSNDVTYICEKILEIIPNQNEKLVEAIREYQNRDCEQLDNATNLINELDQRMTIIQSFYDDALRKSKKAKKHSSSDLNEKAYDQNKTIVKQLSRLEHDTLKQYVYFKDKEKNPINQKVKGKWISLSEFNSQPHLVLDIKQIHQKIAEKAQIVPQSHLHHFKLLILDDNEAWRNHHELHALLQSGVYEFRMPVSEPKRIFIQVHIDTARNLNEAKELLNTDKGQKYDLGIFDYSLPESLDGPTLDGGGERLAMEICDYYINQSHKKYLKPMPIIAFTAREDKQSIEKTHRYPIHYVQKSTEQAKNLGAIIHKYIAQHLYRIKYKTIITSFERNQKNEYTIQRYSGFDSHSEEVNLEEISQYPTLKKVFDHLVANTTSLKPHPGISNAVINKARKELIQCSGGTLFFNDLFRAKTPSSSVVTQVKLKSSVSEWNEHILVLSSDPYFREQLKLINQLEDFHCSFEHHNDTLEHWIDHPEAYLKQVHPPKVILFDFCSHFLQSHISAHYHSSPQYTRFINRTKRYLRSLKGVYGSIHSKYPYIRLDFMFIGSLKQLRNNRPIQHDFPNSKVTLVEGFPSPKHLIEQSARQNHKTEVRATLQKIIQGLYPSAMKHFPLFSLVSVEPELQKNSNGKIIYSNKHFFAIFEFTQLNSVGIPSPYRFKLRYKRHYFLLLLYLYYHPRVPYSVDHLFELQYKDILPSILRIDPHQKVFQLESGKDKEGIDCSDLFNSDKKTEVLFKFKNGKSLWTGDVPESEKAVLFEYLELKEQKIKVSHLSKTLYYGQGKALPRVVHSDLYDEETLEKMREKIKEENLKNLLTWQIKPNTESKKHGYPSLNAVYKNYFYSHLQDPENSIPESLIYCNNPEKVNSYNKISKYFFRLDAITYQAELDEV